MSLLWATAMAWWTGEPDREYEREEYARPEGGYGPLRDPAETHRQRWDRHVSRIVDRHNVPRENAEEALRAVVPHLRSGAVFVQPGEYGFASSNKQEEKWSSAQYKHLQNPETWRHKPVEQVPTDDYIRATQDFVRPSSVAHNLFHPGHYEPGEDEPIGDPDYSPDWDQPEEDRYRGTDEDSVLNGTAKFLRHRDGSHSLLDGHHRVSADLLLGKSHTPGQVMDERELERAGSGSRKEPEHVRDESLIGHVVRDHGFDSGWARGAQGNRREMDRLYWDHETDHDRDRDLKHYHEE